MRTISDCIHALRDGAESNYFKAVERKVAADIIAHLQRIPELEAECFKLAAGVCEHRSGDDHGNPYCLKSKTNI